MSLDSALRVAQGCESNVRDQCTGCRWLCVRIHRRACLSQLIDNTKFVLVPGLEILTTSKQSRNARPSLDLASFLAETRLILHAYISRSPRPHAHEYPAFTLDFFFSPARLRKKRKNCAGARCYRPPSRILPHYAFFSPLSVSFIFPPLPHSYTLLSPAYGEANNAVVFACKWLKAKVKALGIHFESRLFFFLPFSRFSRQTWRTNLSDDENQPWMRGTKDCEGYLRDLWTKMTMIECRRFWWLETASFWQIRHDMLLRQVATALT